MKQQQLLWEVVQSIRVLASPGGLPLQLIQPGVTSCLDTLDNKHSYVFWAKPIFYTKSEGQFALNLCLCFVNVHDYFVLIQLITFPAKIMKGY